MQLPIVCPDYSCLSKRLSSLKLKSPRYRKTDKADEAIVMIAIDSTGWKRFGRDEWHQEKHNMSAKRSWRKLHIAVDDKHIINAATITDCFTSDDKTIGKLIQQIDSDLTQITADSAYDKIQYIIY